MLEGFSSNDIEARVFLKSHYPQSITYHHARPTHPRQLVNLNENRANCTPLAVLEWTARAAPDKIMTRSARINEYGCEVTIHVIF